MNAKKHLIIAVDDDSPANDIGVKKGWSLLELNGECVEDIIDYEQLSANECITALFENEKGEEVLADIEKDEYEPLGLNFETTLMSGIRTCKNRCVFCFIDQMPEGIRPTLHFKDDDWRLSLIMGNYISLTNVGDEEFARMIKRHVSPLYVSVHATDGAVRAKMMGNPSAARIMERLSALAKANLTFDSQIVLCPGYNDGETLQRSLNELFSLAPYARSVAVVPVGLTKYRQKLAPLRPLTKDEAASAVAMIDDFNSAVRPKTGTNFVYASDELYIDADLPLPDYESYDGFPQIENGVGLLRFFERDFRTALKEKSPLKKTIRATAFTGVSAFDFLKKLFSELGPYNIELDLRPVKNRYFGGIVSVAGLVTAEDIAAQAGQCEKYVIIPDDMLRERDDVFLDGHDIIWLGERLGAKIMPLPAADGDEFIQGLFDGLGKV